MIPRTEFERQGKRLSIAYMISDILMILGLLLIAYGVIQLVGCTSAERAKTEARLAGTGATVTCYSGGSKIYTGHSKSKVISEAGSDGYFFTDDSDGKLREVSGECVIVYD